MKDGHGESNGNRFADSLFVAVVMCLISIFCISSLCCSAVLLDTKGPEIRSGFFQEGLKKIDLVKGQDLVLTSDYSFKGNSQKLACSYTTLAKSVTPGQSILVADGSLVLTVKVRKSC
jgi:hypothetical protein